MRMLLVIHSSHACAIWLDDLRESPALESSRALARSLAGRVSAVEPQIETLPRALLEAWVEHFSTQQARAEAVILVGLVASRVFRRLPADALHEKIVVDTGGIGREG